MHLPLMPLLRLGHQSVFKIVMVNLGSDVGAMSWKFVMIVLNVPYGHVHGHTSAIQRIDIATKVFLGLCSGWLGTFVSFTKVEEEVEGICK